ncbi:efflux RND transporter periplasmic adaptor subunit [soil metagenome]
MNTALKIAGIIACLGFASCKPEHATHDEDQIKFVVSSPLRKDTSLLREYVCQIKAIQHIELRALERGYLENILVDEGQLVKKGQPMFQIMPTIYQAEYMKAQAEAKVAEIEYLNTRTLNDSNVVSKNELAMAKARFDHAKAEVALADAHLQFAKISAPFTGIMDRLHVRHGSLLGEGDMLASLSDNSSMWVYFNVPEAQYLNHMTHTRSDSLVRVTLRMANNEVFKHEGVVTTIEADFNNETGNIAFRATFPNAEGLLRHGETGSILMSEALPNALLIPQKATFEVLDKKYVYVVGKDNIVHSRQISIRTELPHIYVVGDGLAVGDKILFEGIRKVKDGDKITYSTVTPEASMESLELHAE